MHACCNGSSELVSSRQDWEHLQQVIDGPGAVRRTTYKEMDYLEKTDNGSVV